MTERVGGSAEPVAPPLDEAALEVARRVLHREMNGEPGDAVAACIAAYLAALARAQRDPPRYEKDLVHLATLAPNWDSYGGVPITPAALTAVRAFIAQLQIVPCSDGGLQIEIHKERHDLEVSFEPDGSIEEVYAENPDDAEVPAPQGDAAPLRAPNNPHEREQRERLAAGDVDGFKRELLRSVQLYADVEAGRTCMGSPVIAENVLAGIAHQLDMLAVRGAASSSGSAPNVVMLAEQFLADEKIWPLGVNTKEQRCVRGFAAWLRGELEVGARPRVSAPYG